MVDNHRIISCMNFFHCSWQEVLLFLSSFNMQYFVQDWLKEYASQTSNHNPCMAPRLKDKIYYSFESFCCVYCSSKTN